MSAYGSFNTQNLPFLKIGAGYRFELGQLLPVSGRVAAYVRSTGPQNYDDDAIRTRLVTTLNQGLAQCRSGFGDVVIVLPGHVENVSAADFFSSLVAGTRVIGLGHGTTRPTFTWTAAAATWLLDVANATIENCILKVADAANAGVSVAAPITVSAAGCAIVGCQIRCDGDANDLATIAVTTTAAADDFTFAENDCYGATAAESTTFLQLVGADRLRMIGNNIIWASSAVGVGVVRFATTASTNILMLGNRIENRKAASTAAVTCMAGVTGFVDDLYLTVLGDHADFEVIGNANGAWAAAAGSVGFGPRVYAANLQGEIPIALTPVSA
jgi:hypothetical protein